MDDIALSAATQKLAYLQERITQKKNTITEAQAELNRLNEQAAELNSWIEMWHRLSGTTMAAKPAEQNDFVSTPKRTRPKNPDRELVVERALGIIDAAGRPINRKELFDALADIGIKIHGKNPEMVLSTMLWRSQDKVARLPNHGYWPADLAYKPANYYPIMDDILGVAAKEPEDGCEIDDDEKEMTDELRDLLS